MTAPELTSTLDRSAQVARAHAGLRMLVLRGSRARGDARADSDWDFAYLANEPFDASSLHADLAIAFGSSHSGFINLATADGLIRYRVARDGVVSFEAVPDTFDRFWFAAVSFWCDAEPVLRVAFKEAVAELER